MFLSRDSLLGKQWPVQEVALPEFDGSKVRVKTLSAAEFLVLAELEGQHPKKAYALWWIACVCDEQGQPLFTVEDIDAITKLPISAVNRVVEVAKKLNHVPQDTAEGNSGATPSAA